MWTICLFFYFYIICSADETSTSDSFKGATSRVLGKGRRNVKKKAAVSQGIYVL